MNSEIWRVVTERIGFIESFKTERDMESFLMNNPAIVGCWDPEEKGSLPSLLRSQIISKSDQEGWGRMDIVGIAMIDDGSYELRIFELKLEEIDNAAVDQLNGYLGNWHNIKGPKSEIKNWIYGLNLKGITDAIVNDIIENPVGVLVGSKFQPEAIKRVLDTGSKIKGIRLARFRGAKNSEYFVIVENQIGTIISQRRRNWSWQQLIDKGLISAEDEFSIFFEDHKLLASPDKSYLKYNWIRVIFNEPSRIALIDKENRIREKADDYAKKWLEKALVSLKKGEGVWLSNATSLCYLAF